MINSWKGCIPPASTQLLNLFLYKYRIVRAFLIEEQKIVKKVCLFYSFVGSAVGVPAAGQVEPDTAGAPAPDRFMGAFALGRRRQQQQQ